MDRCIDYIARYYIVDKFHSTADSITGRPIEFLEDIKEERTDHFYTEQKIVVILTLCLLMIRYLRKVDHKSEFV